MLCQTYFHQGGGAKGQGTEIIMSLVQQEKQTSISLKVCSLVNTWGVISEKIYSVFLAAFDLAMPGECIA